MAINLTGPNWPTVQALRERLLEVPEEGTYHLGGPRIHATNQLIAFRSVGLRTPEFTLDRAEAEGWVREGNCVFGRLQTHSRANDIVGSRHPRFLTSDWWCKYVPDIRHEWRLHTFDSKTIARGVKVQTGPPVTLRRRGIDSTLIRNRRFGWTMDHRVDPPKGLRTIARAAVASLNYPYGAVDVLVCQTPDGSRDEAVNAGNVVVLECNRLPSMDNYTMTAYVEAIRRNVRGGE